MSAASCLLTEEQLLCCICLEVFTDPVTLPCGHNFCRACILRHRDSSSRCSCPACKEPFHRRLDLRVNKFVSEMVTQFRRSGKSSPRVAKPGEVPCDVCAGIKLKALRSCLMCLASYCEAHLKPHLTVSRLKRHHLTDPMENLEGRMCAAHSKPLELFCTTDQTCVCMICPVLDHKSHDMALLEEQFEVKKAELERREDEIQMKIQKRQVKIRDIKRTVKLSKVTAQRELRDGVQVFTVLKQSLRRAQAELVRTIEDRQRSTEKQAKAFIQELELEIFDLVRRQEELEQLWSSKDHLHFLQRVGSLNPSALPKDRTGSSPNLPSHEGTTRTAVDQLQETLAKEMRELLLQAELNRVQQYAVDVTLDPDTAHPALILSDDGRQVRHGGVRNLPDNPARFNACCCVLAKQRFSSGRLYFEVQVKDKTRWTVGVARESIRRKGVVPLCPENGHWTMWLKNGNEYAALVGSPLQVSLTSTPEKVGVFVDYDEGLVSFYDGDTAAVLYSFTGCSFKEKLYPFFSPGLNDDGVNSAPLTIINHASL